MLSIFSTLRETLYLWLQNFWYICALVLFLGMPDVIILNLGNNHLPRHSHIPIEAVVFTLFSLLSGLLLSAAKAVAILGLLQRASLGKGAFEIITGNIRKYTATLAVLMVRIGLWFIPFALLISLVIHLIGWNRYVVIIGTGFYVVLVKYALAYPLVVVENLLSGEALVQSWQMTKGHFGYVLGCYIVLALSEWLFNQIASPPLSAAGSNMSWTWLLTAFCSEVIASLWIILCWCMYLRIKDTEPEQDGVLSNQN